MAGVLRIAPAVLLVAEGQCAPRMGAPGCAAAGKFAADARRTARARRCGRQAKSSTPVRWHSAATASKAQAPVGGLQRSGPSRRNFAEWTAAI
jgi:hypothetical protein